MCTIVKCVALLFFFFFFADLDNVEGIAVDWIGNNLYWTNDGHRKTINVARLEKASQSRKTLLEGEMSHPRGIVVDPVNGYVIFYQLDMRKILFFCIFSSSKFDLNSHMSGLNGKSYSFNDFLL